MRSDLGDLGGTCGPAEQRLWRMGGKERNTSQTYSGAFTGGKTSVPKVQIEGQGTVKNDNKNGFPKCMQTSRMWDQWGTLRVEGVGLRWEGPLESSELGQKARFREVGPQRQRRGRSHCELTAWAGATWESVKTHIMADRTELAPRALPKCAKGVFM